MNRTLLAVTVSLTLILGLNVLGQTPHQPKVAPGPGEPDWSVILQDRYGLRMFVDLLNPVRTTPGEVPALFRKAGPGSVRYQPVIALGLETRTRGGWYPASNPKPKSHELWSYVFKNTTDDLRTNKNLPPPIADGSTINFDPGDAPFGLWVSNDQFDDGGVFTQPTLVARFNNRLAAQPYKAMIYHNRDKASGLIIPHSYLIGWEYSTNDDFQDVVCQIDNVNLIVPKDPP